VSGYGPDDRAIGVRCPAGTKDFSSMLCVSRPALGPTQPPVQWVPGDLSPGVKRGWSVTLTTHPHLVPRLRMSRGYILSPQAPPWCVAGLLYLSTRWWTHTRAQHEVSQPRISSSASFSFRIQFASRASVHLSRIHFDLS
jgi:hypothetical protein